MNKCRIGIDVGATNIKFGLFDENMELIDNLQTLTDPEIDLERLMDLLSRLTERSVIKVDYTRRLYFTSVNALPDKLILGQSQLVRMGTHKDIAVLTALFDYLRKSRRVTEGIEVYRRCGHNSEFLLKISLSLAYLTDKALT